MTRFTFRSGIALAAITAMGLAAPAALGQQQGSSGQRSQQITLNPELEAVSFIGVDLDGDQIADTVYAVSRYDVEQMKRKADSERRMRQQGNPQQARSRQPDQWMQQRDRMQRQDRMQQHQQMMRQRAQMQRQQGSAQNQPVTVSGRIQSTRTVRIPEFRQPHRLAKVQLQSGRTTFVDLGPVATLRGVDTSPGTQIRVSGQRGTLNDRTVIFANRIQADGRSLRVNYQPTGRFGSQASRPQGFGQTPAGLGAEQLRKLSGTVESKEQMTIGDSAPYVFVQLQTDQGPTHLVNLGPAQQLRNVDLQEGDTVTVWASPMTLAGGERIFHTQRFNANGQSFNVGQLAGGRTMTAAFGQQQQQQTQRISGTVESRERVKFGDSEPYIFADVSTDDGRTVLVNLGPEQGLRDVDIQEGDTITATGKAMTLAGGERIIHADRLSTNGQTIDVKQLHERAKQREQQRRMQRGN